jgi:hypothetical protein
MYIVLFVLLSVLLLDLNIGFDVVSEVGLEGDAGVGFNVGCTEGVVGAGDDD